jgi:apolipoprotein D and lipocalin family protein
MKLGPHKDRPGPEPDTGFPRRPKQGTIYQAMKIETALAGAVIMCAAIACTSAKKDERPPLRVVPFVDLQRYQGDWYEIARYPNRFQKGCVGSRASYTLKDDGTVGVLNQCFEGSFGGKLRSAKGRARVVDKETNAKLKVTFFWPFRGDYWIIALGRDYEYAVVGHPKRRYLWILSRTKKMDEGIYEAILGRLEEEGYDTTRLIKTEQE